MPIFNQRYTKGELFLSKMVIHKSLRGKNLKSSLPIKNSFLHPFSNSAFSGTEQTWAVVCISFWLNISTYSSLVHVNFFISEVWHLFKWVDRDQDRTNVCLYVGQVKCTKQLHIMFFNPLSPNSDQHQFSPNNIHTMSRGKAMRINKMIA